MTPKSKSRQREFNSKISDTSLFAELVKDKHKRNKVLQELMEKKDGDNSNTETATANNSVETIDADDNSTQSTGSAQVANGKSSMCLVDIPMPNPTADVMSNAKSNDNVDLVDGVNNSTTMGILPPPPPPPLHLEADGTKPIGETIVSSATTTTTNHNNTNNQNSLTPVILSSTNSTRTASPHLLTTKTDSTSNNNNNNHLPTIKQTFNIGGHKRNLTKLPMPPGVNMADLENITTPSPPGSLSPASIVTQAPTVQVIAKPFVREMPPVKKGLLNLPMPPMVPGSEDLSGDDDIIGSPLPSIGDSNKMDLSIVGEGGGHNSGDGGSLVMRKRPQILHRRNSRSAMKEWGERCVDVFEVITQIGEGTYGQVSFCWLTGAI